LLNLSAFRQSAFFRA